MGEVGERAIGMTLRGEGSYSRAGAFFALRLLFGILLESF